MNSLISKDQSTFEKTFLENFFSGLSKVKVCYAVLRNYEKLPESIGARDIDIIVNPDDLTSACGVVDEVAKKMNLHFGNYFKDERLIQIALVGRDKFQGLQQIKIDFFICSEVYGCELLSAETLLQDSRIHNGIPVVSDAMIVADKWLFHLFVGRPLHKKYDNVFAKIAKKNMRRLVHTLSNFLPKIRAEELTLALADGKGSSILLRRHERYYALLKLLLSNGLFIFQRSAKFIYFRLRDSIFPHGIFLSVSGPDGSGKTTVIKMVISQLESIYGKEAVHYFHYRPSMLPRIADIAKNLNVVKTVDTNYSQPHRAQPSGLITSSIRLCYYWFDYFAGYFKNIHPLLKRRQLVVFDRYYYDLVADSARVRIALPIFILRWILRLLPLPHYPFFIHVDKNETFRRKKELNINKIIELNKNYNSLCKKGWLIEIDNNNEPEIAAANIVDYIVHDRNAQAARSKKL